MWLVAVVSTSSSQSVSSVQLTRICGAVDNYDVSRRASTSDDEARALQRALARVSTESSHAIAVDSTTATTRVSAHANNSNL